MSDELTELRVRIAGDMVECPDIEFKYDGLRVHDIPGAMGHVACSGTGRVYRFGDALRAKCRAGRVTPVECPIECIDRTEFHIHTGVIHQDDCKHCQGRGWVPAENFMPLLLKELKKAGFTAVSLEAVYNEDKWSAYLLVDQREYEEEDPDAEAALYRAVCALLEPNPDAGLEVSEEVEERLLRTLNAPREDLLSPEEAWRRHEEAP